MADIGEMLEEAIENQIMELAPLEAGSEEKSRATEDVATLYKLKIEEAKNEKEVLYKHRELQEQAKDRWFRIGADVVIGVLATGFNLYVFRKGLKFEEEGTFTSGTLRRMMNNFPKPFKK